MWDDRTALNTNTTYLQRSCMLEAQSILAIGKNASLDANPREFEFS